MAALRLRILDGGNRIGFALLASLALHIALLAMLPSLREAHQRKAEADPFHARLVGPAAPAPRRPSAAEPIRSAGPQLEPAKPVALQSQPKRSQSRPATAPAPVAPRVETSPPGLAATDLAEAEPAKSPIAPPSAGVASPSASITASAPPAQETLDAGTLAQYLISIMSAAKQFKRYPRVALDQNWQGRVDVRLVIAPNGEISVLDVRSGTGHAVLDEHALEMIERAKALVQIPPALRGREFALDIPVVFSLRDAGG